MNGLPCGLHTRKNPHFLRKTTSMGYGGVTSTVFVIQKKKHGTKSEFFHERKYKIIEIRNMDIILRENICSPTKRAVYKILIYINCQKLFLV